MPIPTHLSSDKYPVPSDVVADVDPPQFSSDNHWYIQEPKGSVIEGRNTEQENIKVEASEENEEQSENEDAGYEDFIELKDFYENSEFSGNGSSEEPCNAESDFKMDPGVKEVEEATSLKSLKAESREKEGDKEEDRAESNS